MTTVYHLPAPPSVWETSISSNFISSSSITPTPSTSSPPSFRFIRYDKHTLISIRWYRRLLPVLLTWFLTYTVFRRAEIICIWGERHPRETTLPTTKVLCHLLFYLTPLTIIVRHSTSLSSPQTHVSLMTWLNVVNGKLYKTPFPGVTHLFMIILPPRNLPYVQHMTLPRSEFCVVNNFCDSSGRLPFCTSYTRRCQLQVGFLYNLCTTVVTRLEFPPRGSVHATPTNTNRSNAELMRSKESKVWSEWHP